MKINLHRLHGKAFNVDNIKRFILVFFFNTFYVLLMDGFFPWELSQVLYIVSNLTVKHGCAKLFGKTFQEQENGGEVTSRLGLLQKTGPGPIDSQGTNACH